MHIGLVLLVFGIIFIAELPDKSLFASLVLGSKFPGWYVWFGSATAFLVHVIIAVTAGKLLTLLPHNVLEIVVGCLFLLGAGLLFFGKESIENDKQKLKEPLQPDFRKVFATAFTVTFLGEWGDITQITTANYAAKYHDPWSVGIGAVLGLWAVTGLAITVGRRALTLVPPHILQRLTGTILLGFAVFSFLSA